MPFSGRFAINRARSNGGMLRIVRAAIREDGPVTPPPAVHASDRRDQAHSALVWPMGPIPTIAMLRHTRLVYDHLEPLHPCPFPTIDKVLKLFLVPTHPFQQLRIRLIPLPFQRLQYHIGGLTSILRLRHLFLRHYGIRPVDSLPFVSPLQVVPFPIRSLTTLRSTTAGRLTPRRFTLRRGPGRTRRRIGR